LLQEHPELLVTEVDLEEDRDREDYISVMKDQKEQRARDEASTQGTGSVGSTALEGDPQSGKVIGVGVSLSSSAEETVDIEIAEHQTSKDGEEGGKEGGMNSNTNSK
jgi:hypothetical protein